MSNAHLKPGISRTWDLVCAAGGEVGRGRETKAFEDIDCTAAIGRERVRVKKCIFGRGEVVSRRSRGIIHETA
jgi:hypothetical protein